MFTHDPGELEGRLTRYAAIGFATAAIENVEGGAADSPEEAALIRELVARLWRWQHEDRVEGKVNMTVREAQSFPSYQLYSYDEPLCDREWQHEAKSRIRYVLRSVRANLAFILWHMHAVEASLNPGMPFVASGDIAEVDWRTLSEALDHAIRASADPAATTDWQTGTLSRLLKDHPADPAAPANGEPVGRDYFFGGALAPAAASEEVDVPAATGTTQVYRHDSEVLDYRFTYHAEIALMTVVLERLAAELPTDSGACAALRSLGEDLRAWQGAERVQGKSSMSEEEARQLPSYHFDSRVEQLRRLARQQPAAKAKLLAAVDAVGFIAWTMGGIEYELNPDKPSVISEEWDDRDGELGLDALEKAALASEDPDATFQWQLSAIERLTRDYPAPLQEPVGTPLSPAELDALQ